MANIPQFPIALKLHDLLMAEQRTINVQAYFPGPMIINLIERLEHSTSQLKLYSGDPATTTIVEQSQHTLNAINSYLRER